MLRLQRTGFVNLFHHSQTVFLPRHTELVKKLTAAGFIFIKGTVGLSITEQEGCSTLVGRAGTVLHHRAEEVGRENNPFHLTRLCYLPVHCISLREGCTGMCRHRNINRLHEVVVVLWQDLKREQVKPFSASGELVISLSSAETLWDTFILG